MITRVLFLFFLVVVVTQSVSFAISPYAMKAIADVQGKPLDYANTNILIKASVGGMIALVALTVLLYSTLSFDYIHVFILGISIAAFSEGCFYGNFEKWPISLVAIDSLGMGISFVVIKMIYQYMSPNTNDKYNYKPNEKNTNSNKITNKIANMNITMNANKNIKK
jgi:uncharacterized membrane protein